MNRFVTEATGRVGRRRRTRKDMGEHTQGKGDSDEDVGSGAGGADEKCSEIMSSVKETLDADSGEVASEGDKKTTQKD